MGDDADKNIFEMAVAFAKSVKAGEVEVKEQSTEPEAKEDSLDDVPF